mmetsp:Transcript_23261/g.39416  ORF Transcript_23261/g.39416 Transcript_23261/m.39416 type:complete len:345 (-) Transcript_23261:436-1470(-)
MPNGESLLVLEDRGLSTRLLPPLLPLVLVGDRDLFLVLVCSMLLQSKAQKCMFCLPSSPSALSTPSATVSRHSSTIIQPGGTGFLDARSAPSPSSSSASAGEWPHTIGQKLRWDRASTIPAAASCFCLPVISQRGHDALSNMPVDPSAPSSDTASVCRSKPSSELCSTRQYARNNCSCLTASSFAGSQFSGDRRDPSTESRSAVVGPPPSPDDMSLKTYSATDTAHPPKRSISPPQPFPPFAQKCPPLIKAVISSASFDPSLSGAGIFSATPRVGHATVDAEGDDVSDGTTRNQLSRRRRARPSSTLPMHSLCGGDKNMAGLHAPGWFQGHVAWWAERNCCCNA